MRNTKKTSLKLRIRFDFAMEVILLCLIFILFGLAFLFASNLLVFNWGSVICTILGGGLIYLKASSYIQIEKDQVTVQYMKFVHRASVDINQIKQMIFYKDSLLVEIQTKDKQTVSFYLQQKNREKLLNHIVNHYPDIPCLFFDRTD